MYRLSVSLDSPAKNLALDEALLDWAEMQPGGVELVRLWEPDVPFVVVGRSSRLEEEVDLAACQQQGVSVFRRSSGGAAIVTGPGCLMYAVILSYHQRPELRPIDQAHSAVLDRMLKAVRPLVPNVACAGTSDLILQTSPAGQTSPTCKNRGWKFSGNSMRAKRNHFLYHGTLLCNFDLSLITTCLRTPPRQPEYREQRSHDQFVVNLSVPIETLREAIFKSWEAHDFLTDWPREQTFKLATTRYLQESWTRLL